LRRKEFYSCFIRNCWYAYLGCEQLWSSWIRNKYD